jgi:hypothetical protein
MIVPYKKRITGNGTTTVIATSCLVYQIVVTCGVPGATWTLRIQDKATPNPFILVPEFTLSQPSDGYPNMIANFVNPLPMDGGIDIITAAGTATREVAVWMILVTNG